MLPARVGDRANMPSPGRGGGSAKTRARTLVFVY